jgi:hypothetical protein
MKRPLRRAGILLAASALACARSPETPTIPPGRPAGNGVWYEEGFATEQDEARALSAISAGGYSWLLLPAARIEKRGPKWEVDRVAGPPAAVSGVAVSPIIQGGKDVSEALVARESGARRLLEDGLVRGIKEVASDPRFRRIAGVHLDLGLTPQTAPACGEVLRRIRSRLPRGLFVSVTLAETGPAEGQERLAPLAAAADGFVALVFGREDRADPTAVDQLGRPWWAAYSPNAEGIWKGRGGEDRGFLPEGLLARMSDDPKLQLQYDMEVEESAGYGFIFRARRPVEVEGRSFATGDEIMFHQPLWTELVRRLGRDNVGRRHSAGRVVRLAGRSDSDRIFTLPAFNDILAGRPLVPALRVALQPADGTVSVAAENASAVPSVVSRLTNWIEVDLARPGVRDVRVGGFDRYELYNASGQHVSMGRASRVRFYETLIGPFEKIEPAAIAVKPPLAPGCCRSRYHVLSIGGPEAATDWR